MENESLTALFEDFLKLYKFINKPVVVRRLMDELPEELHKKVYELSDGERTSRDIAKIAGINHVAVTKLWKKWAMAGIVVPAKRVGRFMKAFDLNEFGMSVIDDEDND